MTSLISYSFLALAFLLTVMFYLQTRKFKNIPPGPKPLPILGNLHQLKEPVHHTFHRFSQRYGQIFSLWFGSRLVVVISSPSAVQECFTKYDVVLANRPRFLSSKYVGYNHTTLVFSPYGEYWRNLRRITALEVLSTHRLNSFTEMRRGEMKRLIQKLARDSFKDFAKVELKSKITEMTFNTIMKMISRKRYWGGESEEKDEEEARQFRELIKELVELGGANNPGDFLPVLSWFDFDGFVKRLKSAGKRLDTYLQGLLDEHREEKQKADTMIDYLLTMQEAEPDYYTDQIIKGLIFVMLIAGTDTSALTLEWAMSNLLNHPEVLKKAKEEIDIYIGQEHLLDEPDIVKLPYLQNIIFETFRLHPPAPLLVPHMSSGDCIIAGYNVPRDTIVLINAWSVHRDPQMWIDPLSFNPERFEKEGEADKLIQFGLGRRSCPGAGLGQRTVSLTLGLLIQCFEWKRVSEEKIDMTEGAGLTMPKIIPLEAMCKARLPVIDKVFF